MSLVCRNKENHKNAVHLFIFCWSTVSAFITFHSENQNAKKKTKIKSQVVNSRKILDFLN